MLEIPLTELYNKNICT